MVKNRNFEAPVIPTFLPELIASCYTEKSIRLNNNHKTKRRVCLFEFWRIKFGFVLKYTSLMFHSLVTFYRITFGIVGKNSCVYTTPLHFLLATQPGWYRICCLHLTFPVRHIPEYFSYYQQSERIFASRHVPDYTGVM